MANKNSFEFDFSDFDTLFNMISEISEGSFKEAVAEWMEAAAFDFLLVVQDEIIRKGVVDTRLLLNSFSKGKEGNVFKVRDSGLTIEVGTNLSYAQYVNDGHWTVEKGKSARWIPGKWNGDRFIYTRGAKTGMYLKQQWVEGSHYWESAIRIYERMFKLSIETKMEEWFKRYL